MCTKAEFVVCSIRINLYPEDGTDNKPLPSEPYHQIVEEYEMALSSRLNAFGNLTSSLFVVLFCTVILATESQANALSAFTMNGFTCQDITEVFNKEALEAYTGPGTIEDSDVAHICIKTDDSKTLITGNKYLVILNQQNELKTQVQMSTIYD